MSTLFDLSAFTADTTAVGDYAADTAANADPAWDDLELLEAIARSPGIPESELARHLGWTVPRLRQSLHRVRDRIEPHGDGWRRAEAIPSEQTGAPGDTSAIPLEQTDAPDTADAGDGCPVADRPTESESSASDAPPKVVLGETRPIWEPGTRVLHPRTSRRGEVSAVLPSGRVRVGWDGGGRRSAVLPTSLVPDLSPWKPGDRFRENSRLGVLLERRPSRRVPDGWYAEFDGGHRCLVSERYIELAPHDADGQFSLLAPDSPADPDEPPESAALTHGFRAGDAVHYEGEATPYRVVATHGDPRDRICIRPFGFAQGEPLDGSPRWERPEVLRKLEPAPGDSPTPLEQPRKKRRSAKGEGTGRIQWCEANKKRNAAKGKPPNRYAIYQYSYTTDEGLQVKRSVTLKKSQVARVAELIDTNTPHYDILAALGVPKK